MLKKIFPSFIIVVFISCNTSPTVNTAKEQDAIKKTDIAFSDLSSQKGMKAAFLQYIDSGATLLRPGHYPIVGKAAVQYLQNINDSSFSLTWAPDFTTLAISDDLGYTYGVYTYHDKDTTFQGTYVTIWKKQADGTWKFVLDTGNPGVDKKK